MEQVRKRNTGGNTKSGKKEKEKNPDVKEKNNIQSKNGDISEKKDIKSGNLSENFVSSEVENSIPNNLPQTSSVEKPVTPVVQLSRIPTTCDARPANNDSKPSAKHKDNLLRIQEIASKAKTLNISDTELKDMFFFTPFYFAILRRIPWFGVDLRRKHTGLDRIVSPIHDAISRALSIDMYRAFFTTMIDSDLFWHAWLLMFVLAVPVSLCCLACFHSDINCLEQVYGLDDEMLEMFRPPMSCQICSQLTSVPVVTNITREEFSRKFGFRGVPVLVKGAAVKMDSNVSFQQLKSAFRRHPTALVDIDEECQFFGYNTEFDSLSQVFRMASKRAKMLKGEKPWYIGWSSCTPASRAVTRKLYQVPDFIPPLESDKNSDWIFMGGAGHGAHIHIDEVGLPSWQAQLSGRKTWRLIPPYECESACHSLEVTVDTGDILIVDTNLWFHATSILPGGISITIGSEFG